MNPTLLAVLLHALYVCSSHQIGPNQPNGLPSGHWDKGFEQCAVIAPHTPEILAAEKADEAAEDAKARNDQNAIDESAVTAGVQALATHP